MLEQLGCFHFVVDYGPPFGALRKALSESADVRNCLIVLPEAFNYGRFYYDRVRTSPKFSAAEALNELAVLAWAWGVAFVVGLLEPPHSVAYLLEPTGQVRRLCHKGTKDWPGLYTPWTGVDPDNPTTYCGVQLGVLICNEIEDPEGLLRKMNLSLPTRQVLCVPSCLTGLFSGGSISNRWTGRYMVLANSRPDSEGCGSFIANERGWQVVKVLNPTENRLVVSSWAELDEAEHPG